MKYAKGWWAQSGRKVRGTAIAMEAGTAETGTSSVHDSVGRNGIAQPTDISKETPNG